MNDSYSLALPTNQHEPCKPFKSS